MGYYIAIQLYPTSDEEIETSNDLLIVTYAAEVIDDLQNISHVDKNTMENICNEYSYLIEKGFDEDEDAIVIAQEIWDLWLNDPQY